MADSKNAVSSQKKHFADSYQEARERFLGLAKAAGARVEALELKGEKGPSGETLAIDLAVLGDVNEKNPSTLFLHSSGVHGAEGYAGSAIQIQFLSRLSKDDGLRKRIKELKGQKIILVHAVNPYGMAWMRRFNENNVDLNRNFLLHTPTHADMRTGARWNAMYPLFHRTLTPPQDACCECCRFYCSVVGFVCRYGWARSKQAIAGGQYEYPGGLFYGGASLEPGPRMLVAALQSLGLRKDNKKLDRVLHVDVHTGLGRFGVDTLLYMDEALLEPLRSVFGRDAVREMEEDQYRVEGSADYIAQGLLAGASGPASPTVVSVCQEFGTIANLAVLRAMMAENVAWAADRKTPLTHPAKRALRAAFYPDGNRWKEMILSRGETVMFQGLSWIGLELA
mmetsp:Transcript_31028/g.57875  ORF Transcript_31028/g.57875 Transcript_31028/m.57875 type:complete len:395 (-) Transcript_31028:69-1253(-)|eukprot:CAMPEP_0170197646 /NCGR_PEP_ID=MMETSP0040_2-20121228/66852_1 /TAXON_ID=641309 /ORGANISM="Lotharella oceanica, Strain CCMP622" /LENGTH=394 /DNA_ID=CAMNT_0010447363 /DNA_START=78 /DNA_END=1262 /DNA_ORIENTATION=-